MLETSVPKIGARVRQRRVEQGLSLRDLANEVGVTASFLSLLERDLTKPSIDMLWKIARALDVSVFRLLADPQQPSRVVRQGQRRQVTLQPSRLTYELLTPDLNRKLELVLAMLEPGESAKTQYLGQPTEECIFVLEGELEIHLEDENFALHAGDAIYFEGALLREIRSISREKSVWISAITPAVF
jgi:transcriptional regulator with XRE-family HTH domain